MLLIGQLYCRIKEKWPALGRLCRALGAGFSRLSCTHHIRGNGNQVQASGAYLRSVKFDIAGEDNHVLIEKGAYLSGVTFYMRGSGHRVRIGENCRFNRGGKIWIEDENGHLDIGDNTTVEEAHIAVTEAGSRVELGRDCMLAYAIEIRTGDSHSIIDAATGERLNPARDVIIGDHVWIAAHSLILKGVTLGHDSVVATGAVVSKSCEPHSILAGNPAKVIRTGTSWNRQRLPIEQQSQQ